MCGIGGFSGDFSTDLLEKMATKIRHRGPDDRGVVFEENDRVGLLHQRLSILDLSPAGHQPMWTDDRSACIAFNGEIYNFRELRSKLAQKGYRFNSNSDTEVLLNLYLEYGIDLLSKLNGMYAFAIWDARNKHLFVARDGVGIKPFYYAETNSGFIFASELKSLLVCKEVSRELSAPAIFDYLTYLWCPAPKTILSGVKKLEPGCAMIVTYGRIKKHWRHYDLPYSGDIDQKISIADAKEQIANSIYTAVERQLVSDVPVGAFLSGGLDSSAIVAFAKKVNPNESFQCFTIEFDDAVGAMEGMSSDLPYARRVAQHLGVKLNVIQAKPDIINRLEDMIYHLDEPQGDPAAINAMLICELARKHDIKVLLSGAGGDDIFTGYRRHYAIQQEKYWGWIPGFARKVLSGASCMLPVSNPKLRRLAKAFAYADLSSDKRLISYFFWLNPMRGRSLFSEQFQQRLKAYSPAEPLESSLQSYHGDQSRINKALYLEAKHFLADHNLNYTDKMSMASGVEVRVPLLDQDLIALAARLPVNYKQNGANGKWIFKKAMEDYLPHDVIYRPKTGFGVPLRYWLNNQLSPVVDDILSTDSLRARGIFEPDRIRKLIKDDKAGRIDAAYPIFSIICIELWCRLFVDRLSMSSV